jgi:hypothetical protein
MTSESRQEIKYSSFQTLMPLMIPISLYVPIVKMVKQGIAFHEYYWFIFVFIICAYVFWNFIRLSIFTLVGIPGIILSNKTLTITAKGYDIKWKDVTAMSLEVTGVRGSTYKLIMQVKDPWKYISTIKNPLSRYYRWYLKDYSNSFTIDLSSLTGDSRELYDLIEQHYHQHR